MKRLYLVLLLVLSLVVALLAYRSLKTWSPNQSVGDGKRVLPQALERVGLGSNDEVRRREGWDILGRAIIDDSSHGNLSMYIGKHELSPEFLTVVRNAFIEMKAIDVESLLLDGLSEKDVDTLRAVVAVVAIMESKERRKDVRSRVRKSVIPVVARIASNSHGDIFYAATLAVRLWSTSASKPSE